MGDFNATPDSKTYSLMTEAGFKSAYKEVNGQEPEITFPTGLQAPFMDTDPPLCLDFMFYRGAPTLRPVKAVLMGKECLPSDPTIYPSDHMALVVDFEY